MVYTIQDLCTSSFITHVHCVHSYPTHDHSWQAETVKKYCRISDEFFYQLTVKVYSKFMTFGLGVCTDHCQHWLSLFLLFIYIFYKKTDLRAFFCFLWPAEPEPTLVPGEFLTISLVCCWNTQKCRNSLCFCSFENCRKSCVLAGRWGGSKLSVQEGWTFCGGLGKRLDQCLTQKH